MVQGLSDAISQIVNKILQQPTKSPAFTCQSEVFHSETFQGDFKTAAYEKSDSKKCFIQFEAISQNGGTTLKHSTFSNFCTAEVDVKTIE